MVSADTGAQICLRIGHFDDSFFIFLSPSLKLIPFPCLSMDTRKRGRNFTRSHERGRQYLIITLRGGGEGQGVSRMNDTTESYKGAKASKVDTNYIS